MSALILAFALFAVLAVAQFFLSNTRSVLPGFIIPAAWCIAAILICVFVFRTDSGTASVTGSADSAETVDTAAEEETGEGYIHIIGSEERIAGEKSKTNDEIYTGSETGTSAGASGTGIAATLSDRIRSMGSVGALIYLNVPTIIYIVQLAVIRAVNQRFKKQKASKRTARRSR